MVKPTSAPEDKMKSINKCGLENFGLGITITYQFPAHDDLQATLAYFESEIARNHVAIHELQIKLDRFEMRGECASKTTRSHGCL